MKKIKEEIGRNYHTADTSPIPFDYDDGIDVVTVATSDGKWSVKIDVPADPRLSIPAREFNDELMATHFARQQVLAIKSKLENTLVKEYVRSVLKNVL